jgi:hypothetical protein
MWQGLLILYTHIYKSDNLSNKSYKLVSFLNLADDALGQLGLRECPPHTASLVEFKPEGFCWKCNQSWWKPEGFVGEGEGKRVLTGTSDSVYLPMLIRADQVRIVKSGVTLYLFHVQWLPKPASELVHVSTNKCSVSKLCSDLGGLSLGRLKLPAVVDVSSVARCSRSKVSKEVIPADADVIDLSFE